MIELTRDQIEAHARYVGEGFEGELCKLAPRGLEAQPAAEDRRYIDPSTGQVLTDGPAAEGGEVAESDAAWLRDRAIMFDPIQRLHAEEVAKRIESLSDQVERLKKDYAETFKLAIHHQSRAEAAEAECARLRGMIALFSELGKRDNMPYWFDGQWHIWLGTPAEEHGFDTLDSAIDAARAAEGKKHG